MKVGFSTRIISPKKPVFLGGYAARNHLTAEIHDDLYAKAICFDNGTICVALLTIDVVSVMQDQFDQIHRMVIERCGIDNLLICATHNHSAPDTRYGMRSINGDWCDEMIENAVETVCSAVISREPMQLFFGFSNVPEVAHNRRGEKNVDDELFILRAEKTDGKTAGILINYACHCTVLDSNNYQITADYPAFLYKRLSEYFDGATVLFTNAACGNINIGYSADASALGMDMGDIRSFENAEYTAEQIFKGIERALKTEEALPGYLSFLNYRLELPIKPNLPSHIELEQKMAQKEAELLLVTDDEREKLQLALIYDKSIYDNIVEYHTEGKTQIRTNAAILTMDNLAFVSIPGELFCEIGKQIKELFLPEYRCVILGYANGYYGYFPTKEAQCRGGYECETSIHDVDSEYSLVRQVAKAKNRLKQ